jgi:hypothetical protein
MLLPIGFPHAARAGCTILVLLFSKIEDEGAVG